MAAVRYAVTDVWTKGKVYALLIEDVSGGGEYNGTPGGEYTSWIDEKLSDYNSFFCYEPRDSLASCWRQGDVLD